MKYLILLISLFSIAFTFAQQTLKVEYNQIFNTDFPLIRTALLQVNPTSSVYVDIIATRRDLANEESAKKSYLDKLKVPEEVKSSNHFVINIGGNFDNYFFYDSKTEKLSYTDELSKKQFYITDDYKLNWQITTETKTIANYKTYKAITKFRGRTWEAWFAPELAHPYGPWKLHGLPGLILEAYDTSKRYSYIAIKIFKDDKNISLDVTKLPKLDFKTFTLQDFEFKDNILFAPITRNTKVINYNEERKGEEIVYEWETETK